MKYSRFSMYSKLCFILLFLFIACKKEPKPIAFTGQLLLTKKHPVSLANKKMEIHQQGTAPAIGINSGSTSSSAKGITDANGYFRINFTPGTSSFIIFSGISNSPLILSSAPGDTSFPNFSRSNFPDSLYDSSKPMYVGKSIDTAIIKVNLISNLIITDTIGLQTNAINGSLNKEYTGLSGNAGTIITIDTIYNLLLTSFDCAANKFTNSLYAGRKWTTVWGYNTISSEGFISPYLLSATDETKIEMTFHFKKF